MSFLSNATVRVAAIVILTLGLAAVADAQCVQYSGFVHCPEGNATLKVSPNGSKLITTNLDQPGNGLTADLGRVTSWRTRVRHFGLGLADEVVLASRADGIDTSMMRMRRTSGNRLVLQAEFTGALAEGTFRLWLLDDDDDSDGGGGGGGGGGGEPPRGGPGGLGPGAIIELEMLEIEDPIENDVETGFETDNDDEFLFSAPRRATAGRAAPGACSWDVRVGDRVRVWVDGQYVGEADQIVLLEDAWDPNHYSYTEFHRGRITSSGNAFVIHEESVIAVP